MSEYEIKGKGLRVRISDSISSFSEDWKTLSHNNIYADPLYLNLLETYGPYSYKYCYAILYDERNHPLSAMYFQFKRIELKKDFRLHTHSNSILKRSEVWFKRQFLKLINQNLLIFGNVLLTGEYAYGIDRPFELTEEIMDLVFKKVKHHIKQEWKLNVHAILAKDFFIEGAYKEHQFPVESFTEFQVQPAMIMDIDGSWKHFDDYLAAVRSKYRVKFRKVMKMAKDIDFKEMDIDLITEYNDRMFAMYKGTAERASFSLFKLHEYYFLELKKAFQDRIVIMGMFLEDQLLGFYTFVNNNGSGDAHFIGYDVRLNAKYNLYFNILLGLIDQAIKAGSSHLNLSRTALEIKSSVGAEPHGMNIYLRHESTWINRILPFVLSRIVPQKDWQPRSPFR